MTTANTIDAPTAFAVYGTLLEGGPLAGVIDGLGQHGDRVEIPDAQLFDLGGFPGLRPGAGTVHAQLWHPWPGCEEAARAILDRIEGYRGPGQRNHYDRRMMRLADGREAAVYVYATPLEGSDGWRLAPRIESGDWRDVASNGARYAR